MSSPSSWKFNPLSFCLTHIMTASISLTGPTGLGLHNLHKRLLSFKNYLVSGCSSRKWLILLKFILVMANDGYHLNSLDLETHQLKLWLLDCQHQCFLEWWRHHWLPLARHLVHCLEEFCPERKCVCVKLKLNTWKIPGVSKCTQLSTAHMVTLWMVIWPPSVFNASILQPNLNVRSET